MVFCCQCWDIDDTRGQANTRNDNLRTNPPDFNLRPPAPQIVWNKWSDVPSPNVRSYNTFRFFTLEEIIEATNNFDPSSKIGEGGSGSVHMGMVKSLDHPFENINIRVVVQLVKRGQKASLP